jgi:hypothetical protein
MRHVLRDNGLSIVLLLLFVFTVAGQSIAGLWHFNEKQRQHGQSEITYGEYIASGEFLSTVFENWESEFLQMALYVWLTCFLYQRGSAESKDPDKKEEPEDEDPRKHSKDRDAPGPVRAGGFVLKVYERSLVLTLLLLFIISFVLHLTGSTRQNCLEQTTHGEPCASTMGHLATSTFWFESLQNWQSEFLSIAAVVVLSIFLRQRGSPESKPVHVPHTHTGR